MTWMTRIFLIVLAKLKNSNGPNFYKDMAKAELKEINQAVRNRIPLP